MDETGRQERGQSVFLLRAFARFGTALGGIKRHDALVDQILLRKAGGSHFPAPLLEEAHQALEDFRVLRGDVTFFGRVGLEVKQGGLILGGVTAGEDLAGGSGIDCAETLDEFPLALPDGPSVAKFPEEGAVAGGRWHGCFDCLEDAFAVES